MRVVHFLTSNAASNYGSDFFIGLPESFGFLPESHLVIGSPLSIGQCVSYTVETASGVIAQGCVSLHAHHMVTLSYSELVVTDSVYTNREKGIHIHADGEGMIFVVLNTVTPYSGGFANLLTYPCPKEQQEKYEYYAVSTTSQTSLKSQVLLVACEDNTEVTVTPTTDVTLPLDTQTIDSPLVAISAGDNHTFTLNQMQTFLLYSSAPSADITGSNIVSTKPLTVISGHQCGNVPISYSFCEQLAVQVPPVTTWGTDFLLTPFAGRTSGQYYKIVTSRANTTITYKCGSSDTVSSDLTDPGASLLFSTTPSTYCYLHSSKSILVVQLATGGSITTGGDNLGDPVMTMVAPLQQYVTNMTFLTIDSIGAATHSISIAVVANDSQSSPWGILLDDLPLNCEWTEMQDSDGCIVGYGCTLSLINSGPHSVSSAEANTLFSAIVHGFVSSPHLQGYAYLSGLALQNLEHSGMLLCSVETCHNMLCISIVLFSASIFYHCTARS